MVYAAPLKRTQKVSPSCCKTLGFRSNTLVCLIWFKLYAVYFSTLIYLSLMYHISNKHDYYKLERVLVLGFKLNFRLFHLKHISECSLKNSQ